MKKKLNINETLPPYKTLTLYIALFLLIKKSSYFHMPALTSVEKTEIYNDKIIIALYISTCHSDIPVSLTTKAVELASHHGEVYPIQFHVRKSVSDFGQVAGFLFVLRFLSSIKFICVNIYMWLKATLNTNNYLTTTY
jgi:hypothetical protein